MEKTITTSDKIRDFSRDLIKMAMFYDEKMAAKSEMLDRLSFIFHGDDDLARTVYDYVARGHKAYCNQLRERFKSCKKKQ